MEPAAAKNDFTFEDVISDIVKMSGVWVCREPFLRCCFREQAGVSIDKIIADGPVAAGCDRKTLKKIACDIISERTMGTERATLDRPREGVIPAELIRFYAAALQMAQELAYLYGEKDFRKGEEADRARLMAYFDALIGDNGALQRPMTPFSANQAFNSLPQLGIRLANGLEDKHFGYTQSRLAEDWREIISAYAEIEEESRLKKREINPLEAIREAKRLYDSGVLTDKEFLTVKEKMIRKM